MKYLILIFFSIKLFALTPQQIYTISDKYTKYPSWIVGIAGTESSFGKNILGDDGHSLGTMQIQVATAKFIAKRDKSLSWLLTCSDRTIQKLLLRNDSLSIEIASKLINYHAKRHGIFGAISRYNGGANNHKYFNKVVIMKDKWLLGDFNEIN